ncbi:MAG: argininosuccinate lyase [Thermoflexibacter sp.]|jgi:argininosuccinate lyase|nr:argininosuccinate lyase [Thermoflexibacter sp.]
MKLWQKNYEVKDKVSQFTIGKDRETDLFLAEFDVIGSLAHIKMLQSIGLLTIQELQELEIGLKEIYQSIQNHTFLIQEGIEDVHSQVEFLLTEKLGEVGKKIHSGRSRNDQVLVDIKLFIRHELQSITNEVKQLFSLLILLSEKHKDLLLVGYTHFQIAMPSSFGLWFGAYAESLVDDLLVLQSAYHIANQNPLGSAAGYGTSFPLNRKMTTELLGFEELNYNSVYAQMTRGKTEKIAAFAISCIGGTLNKLSSDICLYMSQNFDFLTFPKEFTTGSSIMPHKKNPDVFELIRAKCSRLAGLPNEINLILANMPSGYHRDLQLIKENIIPAFNEIKDCLQIATYLLENIIVREDIVNDEKYKYIFSVEVVNQEVLQGMSFRDAYKKVGLQIENGEFEPIREVRHTHEGSIGNLSNDEIQLKMNKVLAGFDFEKAQKMYQLVQ